MPPNLALLRRVGLGLNLVDGILLCIRHHGQLDVVPAGAGFFTLVMNQVELAKRDGRIFCNSSRNLF